MKRPPGWGPDLFLTELKVSGRSVTEICKYWAEVGDCGWKALFHDTLHWRKKDPLLAQQVKDILAEKYPGVKFPSGRKRLDQGIENADWRVAYTEKYLETGSKVEAAAVTPYKPDTILGMLDPKREEYDRELHDLVIIASKRIVDRAAQLAYKSLDLGMKDVESNSTRTTPRDVNHMAISILKNTRHSGDDWNPSQQIELKGHIMHEARVQHQMTELISEQKAWFQKHRVTPALESGELIELEAIEEKERADA